MKKLKIQLANILHKISGLDKKECFKSIIRPKIKAAHLSSTIAFIAAKKLNKSPQTLALEFSKFENWPKYFSKIEAQGPYINFYFNSKFFVEFLDSEIKFSKKSKKLVIEYPSVNPNKPWHVGHLRNALLGDSIANLFSVYGYAVLRLDYIDDLGLQVAQSFWGFKNIKNFSIEQDFKYKDKFDHLIGREYVEVSKLFENENVAKEVRVILKELEEGKSPTALEAKEFVLKVLNAQYQTAFRFNIEHDLIIFESDIIRSLFDRGLKKIKDSGVLVFEKEGKNANCWIINLEGEEFKNLEHSSKVVIRSDGTSTYIAKDIIFQLWKFGILEDKFLYDIYYEKEGKKTHMSSNLGKEKYKFIPADIVINIIGAEQAYLQNIIRYVIKKMGYEKQAKNYIHLGYEHVMLADTKFSGRSGTWIGKEGQIGYSADELADEAIRQAYQKVSKDYSEDERIKIAQAIAINAIKFWFLKTSANQKIIFDFQRALSFEGDSAPYVQYSYIRAKNILQKAGENELDLNLEEFSLNEHELNLVLEMVYFSEVIEGCVNNFNIHSLCQYSLDLAEKFNKFYENCPVLTASIKEKKIRLKIIKKYVQLMKIIFDILGFFDIKRM